MIEEWRPIVGYEGVYSISSIGRVRRDLYNGGNTVKGHILKPSIHRDGYPCLRLTHHGRSRTFCLHQLVTPAFHGPRPEGMAGKRPLFEPNHKDGNKLNNRADNLEWTTKAANTQHSYDSGLQIGRKGEANAQSKLTESAVREIRESNLSNRALGLRHGVSHRVIFNVRHDLSWTHVPTSVDYAREAWG